MAPRKPRLTSKQVLWKVPGPARLSWQPGTSWAFRLWRQWILKSSKKVSLSFCFSTWRFPLSLFAHLLFYLHLSLHLSPFSMLHFLIVLHFPWFSCHHFFLMLNLSFLDFLISLLLLLLLLSNFHYQTNNILNFFQFDFFSFSGQQLPSKVSSE